MTAFHTEPFKTPEDRSAAAALAKPRRQQMIKNLLYRSPLFKQGVDFISEFHHPVEESAADAGVIGGLLGESHAGKTKMCEYYLSRHAGGVGEWAEVYPVIYLPATEQMTPSQMAEQLYHLTGARSIPNIKTASLMRNAILRLAAMKTELVIIDDAQFLFFDRVGAQVRAFRGFVKELADAKLFNVLLVGEERMHEAIHQIKPLANRGGFPANFVRPLGNDGTEFEMFRLLLAKIDDRLPFLSKSGLENEVWAKDFHHYSGGKIGPLMNMISRAAYMALRQDTACVMVEHLRAASDMLRAPNDRYPYFAKRA